jgi:hypothetical protein
VTGTIGVSDGFVLAQKFDGLHMRFRAEKHSLGQPNTLDLEVFNIAASTRKKLQTSQAWVQLLAGYESDGENLPLVFQGNARTIDHIRNGADWITRIQCGDGENGYRFGVASLNFQAGTRASEIAIALAQQVQLAEKNPDTNSSRLDISDFKRRAPTLDYPQAVYVNGHAAWGNAFAELQKVVGSKYELSIQDGALRCLKATEGVLTTLLISPKTGMIGSPEHGTPPNPGLPSVLRVRCLMDQRIRPGDIIAIESQAVEKAGYRVMRVIHSGDLGGNDWQSEIEALPATLTTAQILQ